MNIHNPPLLTVADLIELVQPSGSGTIHRRDTISALKRIAVMIGASPQSIILKVPYLRDALAAIRPASHGVSEKTLSNLKWRFASALEQVGIIDRIPRGLGQKDPVWKDLVAAIADSKRRAYGLAAFINWCAANNVPPDQVSDEAVSQFADWILSRTLYAKPKDIIRRVPRIWNEVQNDIPYWPSVRLTEICFRALPGTSLGRNSTRLFGTIPSATCRCVRSPTSLMNTPTRRAGHWQNAQLRCNTNICACVPPS